MDIVPILTFLILFIFVSMIAYVVYLQVQASGAVTSTTGQNILDRTDNVFNIIDTIFIFLCLGLGVTVVVAAMRIQTSPAFFFISVFLLAIMLFLAAMFSNIFDDAIDADVFAPTLGKFSTSIGVMNNLPMIILGVSALILVAMYAVTKFEI